MPVPNGAVTSSTTMKNYPAHTELTSTLTAATAAAMVLSTVASLTLALSTILSVLHLSSPKLPRPPDLAS